MADEPAKLATRLTPPQLALFRAVVRPRASVGFHWLLASTLFAVIAADKRCACRQVEAVSSDPAKADAGVDSTEVFNLLLSSGGAGAASQAPQFDEEGAGPSAAPAPAVKLTPKEREAALSVMVEDGWLAGEAEGGVYRVYRLGPRSFLELGPYLLETACEEVRAMWEERV